MRKRPEPRRVSHRPHGRPHMLKRARQESSGRPLLVVSANSSWNLLNFCRGQIRGLQDAGYSIAAMVPPDKDVEQLAALGVAVHPIPMSQHGLSPIADLRLLARYSALLRRLRPAAYLGITAKPNIYGGLAAQLSGIPVINSVTGLGTGFLGSRWLEMTISALYWAAFRRAKTVFFLNKDDHDLFIRRKLVRPETAAIIPGSGIDLDRFRQTPPPQGDHLTFLYIGRMLTDKGVREYLEAARIVKDRVPGARIQLLGPLDPHPKAVPAELLQEYERQGIVELLGSTDDVRPYIAAADCIVLPSYREGLPRVLVEASAMARPMIASDVPGCRDVVENDVTGYLCEARSGEALAAAMLRLASHTTARRAKMGQLARRKAEREFGDDLVTGAYVQALDAIVAAAGKSQSRRASRAA